MASEASLTTGHRASESRAFIPCLPTEAARVWQQVKMASSAGESAPGHEGPLSDLAAEREAVLTEACQEAERIIAGAQQEAQRLRQEADQARAEAQRSRADAQRAFDGALELLISQFDEQLSERLGRFEREVPEIIIEMVEKVIGQRIERDSEVVVGVIRGALGQVAAARQIEVLVNPADEPAVRAAQDALLRGHGGGLMTIVGSDEVDRGGAIIRTEHGGVDARIRVQLSALAQAIRNQSGGPS